jgi:hypothetical protein
MTKIKVAGTSDFDRNRTPDGSELAAVRLFFVLRLEPKSFSFVFIFELPFWIL